MTPTQAKALVAHLEGEFAAHRTARAAGNTDAAWAALERAHVLSQPALGAHVRVHARMLSFAVALRDPREAFGQLARLALAPLGSLTGRIPWGNTGRANVSAFAPMPLPEDLRAVLDGITGTPAPERRP